MLKSFLFLFLLTLTFACQKERAERTLLFVGSFTDKKPGKGIKVYDFNPKTGEATLTFELDSLTNSSFLRLSPNGKNLYSVMESQLSTPGKIAAFSIDSLLGKITLINVQECGGRNPAHLEIDKKGDFLINSNYTDPSLSVFKINPNGSIRKYHQLINFTGTSIIKDRQESAHIHSANFSPNDDLLFVQDLGSDLIRRFKVDRNEEGSLVLVEKGPVGIEPGSGPRHFTFHPNGKYAYGIAELSGKVTAYRFANGNLEFLEDYPAYQQEQTIYRSADIHISPDGQFLYASNRGPEENSIALFSIDNRDGKLALVGHESTHGDHPRNFVIDPSGNYLLVANQFSNRIILFKRDLISGKLVKMAHEISTKAPSSLQMRVYYNE